MSAWVRPVPRYLGGGASYFWPETLTRDNTNVEHEAQGNPDFYLTDAISDNASDFIAAHFSGTPMSRSSSTWRILLPIGPARQRRGHRQVQGPLRHGLGCPLGRATGAYAGDGHNRPRSAAESARPRAAAVGTRRQQALADQADASIAAQIDRMDQGIGRVIDALRKTGQMDNTLIIFLADNGGCHEELDDDWTQWIFRGKIARPRTRDGRIVRVGNDPGIAPGAEDTYCSYGVPWANLSNTPFRMYKCWVHEGGIPPRLSFTGRRVSRPRANCAVSPASCRT